jgi:hypothetical protein
MFARCCEHLPTSQQQHRQHSVKSPMAVSDQDLIECWFGRLTVPEIVKKLGLNSTSELRLQWRRLKDLGKLPPASREGVDGMVPSMDHCGIQNKGPGPAHTGIDPLTALEQWVEEGKAPTELIATRTAPSSNQTLWRRPVCAYPKAAHYKGSGDPTDATSFTCTDP